MGTYTTSIDISHINSYKEMLEKEDCVFLEPQYMFFQAKNKNWQVSFYKSGKVVVQGKEIEYITEKCFGAKIEKAPQIEENGEIAKYPHIGIDESGKGDFFGPLVVAGCYLTKEAAIKLKEMGAVDSKKLDDKKILQLSATIKENSIFEIVVIGNKKYNELYLKFKNLNKMLAWGHSTVLENLLNKTKSEIAISDKFADEKVILNALKDKGKKINLIQVPKAEKDTAVACASILARAEFVNRISKLSFEYQIELPKGASDKVLNQGKKFSEKYGIEELKNVAKTHFKTYDAIACKNQISLF